MKLNKIFTGVLVLACTFVNGVGVSAATLLKGETDPQRQNANPSDTMTKVVVAYDPADRDNSNFKLLLTNYDADTGEYAGYRMECDDNALMNAMYVGLGYNIDHATGVEWKNMYSPEIIGSGYENRMTLNCRSGDTKDLYKVYYPEDLPAEHVQTTGWKYFLLEKDGTFGANFHMVGCQGLMTAMGLDINNAIPMDYQSSQHFFVNFGDENDIHCSNGERVGYCGSYPHGDTWITEITNGDQHYTCDSGVSVPNGEPVCDNGYEVQGRDCVELVPDCGEHPNGSTWLDNITNGQQTYQCDRGVVVSVGAPICNSDSTEENGHCYRKCGTRVHNSHWDQSVTNGSQAMFCDDGRTVAGDITCNPDSSNIGNVCYKGCGSQEGSNRNHNDSWFKTITHGKQSMSCDNGNVIAGVVSCDSGSTKVGNACFQDCGVQDGQNRIHGSSWTHSLTGGSQSMSCNNGVVLSGEVSCLTGFTQVGNVCYQDCGTQDGSNRKHGESWPHTIPNGNQAMSCVNGSVLTGVTTCNSNSTNIGNACFLKCGANDHGDEWESRISNGYQTLRCDNGNSNPVGSPSCDSHYKVSGNQCVYDYAGCGYQDGAVRAHDQTWLHTITGGKQTLKCDDGSVNVVSGETVCSSGYSTGFNSNHDVCYKNCGSYKHDFSYQTSSCSGGDNYIRTYQCRNGSNILSNSEVEEGGCGGGDGGGDPV